MALADDVVIDWRIFERTRTALGDSFARVYGYFLEDGEKSVLQIQSAIRNQSAAQLIAPAHCIKGEALHIGAVQLGRLAAHIEYVARDCVELRQSPTELISYIAQLRPSFTATIAEIEQVIEPLGVRRNAA